MMKKLIYLSIFSFVWLVAVNTVSFAQDGGGDGKIIEPAKPAKWRETTDWKKHPRLEDHFWRKKVRYRIDLLEKPNESFMTSEAVNLYDDNSKIYNSNKDRYEYVRGVINALMSAYANNYMVGYSPDTLDNVVEFNQFKALYNKQAESGAAQADPDSEATEEEDDWDNDNDDATDKPVSSADKRANDGVVEETSFDQITKWIDVIEDRIFDKNKSDMFYEPEYIILGVKKPGGGGDVPIIAFRYEDIKDTVFAKCRWKNRFNDAEYRTIKEIFELRLFDSYITRLAQEEMQSIDQAEKKRQQLVEYEHNLFEF